MKFQKMFSLVLLAGVILTSVYAQNIEGVNARLDGWAGCGIPDDIGWACMQPRKFIQYADNFQGSVIIILPIHRHFLDNYTSLSAPESKFGL